jgi:hypothetical protein
MRLGWSRLLSALVRYAEQREDVLHAFLEDLVGELPVGERPRKLNCYGESGELSGEVAGIETEQDCATKEFTGSGLRHSVVVHLEV